MKKVLFTLCVCSVFTVFATEPECYTADGKPGKFQVVEKKEVVKPEMKAENITNMCLKDSKSPTEVRSETTDKDRSQLDTSKKTRIIINSGQTVTREECVELRK